VTSERPRLLPAETSTVVDTLTAVLDDRLDDLRWVYEQRWEHQTPAVREWLREILNCVLLDMRRDAIALLRDLVATECVH
jgi:hypothetical protein